MKQTHHHPPHLACGLQAGRAGAGIVYETHSASEPRLNGHRNSILLIRGSLFLIGLGLTLNTCSAATSELLASANSASMIGGIYLETGLLLGAVFVTIRACAMSAAHFSVQIRDQLSHQHSAFKNNTRVALLVLTNTATAMGRIKS